MKKQKPKNYLKIGILIFIASFFSSCSDNQPTDIESSETQQIQSKFSLKNFNDPYIKENLIVDWNDFNIRPTDSITNIYEYNTSFKVKRILENDNSLFDVKYKILAIKDSLENWSFELIKFLANDNSPLNNTSYFNPNAFSGTLYHYNLDGETIKLKAYNNGELLHEFIPNGLNTNNAQLKYYPKKQSNVEPVDPNESGGYYMLISTIHYTDWYANNQGGSTLYYTHSVYNSTTYEYVYISNDTSNYTTSIHSHTSPQLGSLGGTNNHNNEFIFDENALLDDKIDDSELTGKEKCLHSLLDKEGSSYIKDLMFKFKGESEFDVKIVSKDKVMSSKTGEEVNGTTSGIINDVITISISASKANSRSGLDVARTILHEFIHADIRRKMKTVSPSDGDEEFRDDFEQYGEDHHEAMGALYVNSMRDAMKHFHKNVLTDDYNKYTAYYEEEPSDAFYEALAWRGLKEHDVKAWTDLTSTKKQELESLSLRVDVLTKVVTCPE